jgi:hypothetical protein
MISGISPRDLELVSTYLDDGLSADKKAEFEQRLKTDRVLAEALLSLQQTRALLKRAPQRRLPRSFSIRVDMVNVHSKGLFAGWTSLNLVSAAASLVLVFVFAGEIWAQGGLVVGAPAPAIEAPMALQAQESEEDAGFAATETATPAAGADEYELFADEIDQRNIQESQPFDLRLFLLEYARPIEIGLVLVALIAGIAAWQRRRRT